jgi:hypothetical protein
LGDPLRGQGLIDGVILVHGQIPGCGSDGRSGGTDALAQADRSKGAVQLLDID